MTYKAPDLMGQAIHFRKVMDQSIGAFNPTAALAQMRLISEEYQEVIEAHCEALTYIQNKRSRENLLKELADVVFVCFQYAAAAGWELDEALDRVYESNMSKLVDGKPLKREDGKVLKGPNYHQPYLQDLV
jgi:NTP pyrophosphatase (non-canonical NTP hydrolase)